MFDSSQPAAPFTRMTCEALDRVPRSSDTQDHTALEVVWRGEVSETRECNPMGDVAKARLVVQHIT